MNFIAELVTRGIISSHSLQIPPEVRCTVAVDSLTKDLICRAKELTASQDYLAARTCYTEALLSNPFNTKLWNDRAFTHLKLEYPELALSDAARCLMLLYAEGAKIEISDPEGLLGSMIKAQYYCSLALEDLHNFEIALEFVEQILTCVGHPDLPQGETLHQTLLEKKTSLESKIKESSNIHFDPRLPIDSMASKNIGTMRVDMYPWNDFEELRKGKNPQEHLKKLNETLLPLLRSSPLCACE